MKLNREETLRFIEDYKRLAIPMEIIGINVFMNGKCLQLETEAFLELVGDDYTVTERKCDRYPWHLESMVNGMRVYTISETKPISTSVDTDIVMEIAK